MFRQPALNYRSGLATSGSFDRSINGSGLPLTADFEAVSSVFSDPDKFAKADPFPFLLAALIVLMFGAGRFSVDALIKRRLG